MEYSTGCEEKQSFRRQKDRFLRIPTVMERYRGVTGTHPRRFLEGLKDQIILSEPMQNPGSQV
jgi:hypothetical protein